MTPRPRRALRVVAPAAVAAALLFGVAAALIAAGIACFVVTTPSMGTAAPVGALVVVAPLGAEPAARGDVVAFRPPGEAGTVYVHRVAQSGPAGLRTRGDANPQRDPWTLQPGAVLGRAVAVLPGAGFVVRAAPILLLGAVLVAAGTALLRDPPVRSAVRLLGASAVVSTASLVVRPFVGLTVLAAAPLPDGGLVARVVSTGVLPVLVSGGDRSVVLGAGATARVVFSDVDAGVRLHAALAFDWWHWAGAVALCLLPTACALLLSAHGRIRRSASP